MNDWVKIALFFVAVVAIFKVMKGRESFISNVTTHTGAPTFGTPLSSGAGMPLTDALPPPTSTDNRVAAIDTDLLPKPAVAGDNDYAEFVPNPAAIANQSFLEPAKYIGMDTTSGSKRHQSRDIRPDIPIPACPNAWGNVYMSTLQADPWRKNVCDGTLQGPAVMTQRAVSA